MEQATRARWSVEESVARLKRLHYVLKRLAEAFCVQLTSEPIYELKTVYSYHAYLCSEQVELIRRRVSEMREPPLGLDKVPCPALERLLDEISAAPKTFDFVQGCYSVLLPAILKAVESLKQDAHPLADAPTVRIAKLMGFELAELVDFGNEAVCRLQEATEEPFDGVWLKCLNDCLSYSGYIDGKADSEGEIPERVHSGEFQYDSTPKRDQRFQDPFNAGVNPEVFLYDETFSSQDKTLMMYYKRIRELDVPEMMSSILVDIGDEEPWGFHYEMLRQLWDEARHAMMGEVGFVSLGLDWTQIPINFTWSRNLNQQLSARERHGVLFFIEQGLMPKSGKRYEWEVAMNSGDPLSGLFQDFDWADEVLHAQIGRRWYVPRYNTLNEALGYGDRCWSQVLSKWSEYKAEGITEHRNWWPEVYSQACKMWGKEPDPAALAFNETYEDRRADLKEL